MNPRLRVALRYARQGWPVLPCGPDGKALCEHGVFEATTDEALIRAWWARWPKANIGTSQIIVLNVIGHGGEEGLTRLEGKHGKLPETRTVGTAQGRQLHFLPNGSVVPADGGSLGPRVNVLGTDQPVLLPPSTDEDGLRSEWLSLVKPAQLPAWVIQALITAETQQKEPFEGKQDTTPAPIGKLECAKRFLLEAFKDGPVKSETIKRQAASAGYSEKTLYRARKILGVEVKKVGFGEGQHWEWLLPQGRTPTKLARKKAKRAVFESSHGTLRNQAEASGPRAGEDDGLYGAIPAPFPDAEWQPGTQRGLQ